jgi:hypothetical protein
VTPQVDTSRQPEAERTSLFPISADWITFVFDPLPSHGTHPAFLDARLRLEKPSFSRLLFLVARATFSHHPHHTRSSRQKQQDPPLYSCARHWQSGDRAKSTPFVIDSRFISYRAAYLFPKHNYHDSTCRALGTSKQARNPGCLWLPGLFLIDCRRKRSLRKLVSANAIQLRIAFDKF